MREAGRSPHPGDDVEPGALSEHKRVRVRMQTVKEESESAAQSETLSVTDWLNDQSLTVLSHRQQSMTNMFGGYGSITNRHVPGQLF